MKRKLSISAKVILLFFASFLLLFLVGLFFQYRHSSFLENQIQAAMLESDNNLLQEVLKKQNQIIEKTLSNVIGIKELSTFLLDPSGQNARLIVSGLFLTMKNDNIVRFVVYDKTLKPVLNNAVEALGDRIEFLPDSLKPLFMETAEDFKTRFYFRCNPGAQKAAPLEYSAATVVADADDNPIGFVEVAIDPSSWLNELAEGGHCAAGIFDPLHQSFSLNTAGETFEKLKALTTRIDTHRSMVSAIDKKFYYSDLLPLEAPGGTILSWLWLARDQTEKIYGPA